MARKQKEEREENIELTMNAHPYQSDFQNKIINWVVIYLDSIRAQLVSRKGMISRKGTMSVLDRAFKGEL